LNAANPESPCGKTKFTYNPKVLYLSEVRVRRAFLFRWGCTLFFMAASSYGDISTPIQQITEPDQTDLEQFFQLLIKRGKLGYTLFGEKPMSMAVFLSLEHSTENHIMEYLILEKGWQAWLRNKHHFSDEHFVLHRVKEKTLSFHLINKKTALEKIHENFPLFQVSANDHPENILSKICCAEKPKAVLLSDELLGILFGYGNKNARCFEVSTNLLLHIGRHMIPPFSSLKVGSELDPETKDLLAALFSRKRHTQSRAHLARKDIDALNHFLKTRQPFSLQMDAPFLTQFSSPGFYVWDEDEMKKLEDSYSKTLSRMKEVYQTGFFLEKTLQQWNNPS